jgi:hypothetical protein
MWGVTRIHRGMNDKSFCQSKDSKKKKKKKKCFGRATTQQFSHGNDCACHARCEGGIENLHVALREAS